MNKICINGFIPAKDARHAGTFSNVRKIAFTLAEVLVTLGIIGVVSAMTVPSLMQNHQRKTYVTQLHKVYNLFSQASVQYMNDNNALNMKEAGITSQTAADEFIKKYFKIALSCGTDAEKCFAAGEYKKMNGVSAEVAAIAGMTYYILADGSAIGVVYQSSGMQIQIDINGKKGPNIVGRDVFAFRIYNSGVIDEGGTDAEPPLSAEQRENIYNTYCSGNSQDTWWGCFGKIVNDGWEMTY